MKLTYMQRPVAVLMITLGLVVFGVISLFRLPQELLPNLSEPTLTVETEFPDASPKEVERLITKDLEKSLGTLSGLKKIESFSQPSKSIVKLKFGWGHDIEQAIQQVREATNRQRFPQKAKAPKIMRFDPSMEPVARISFSSTVKDAVTIRTILDQNIRPVLETYPGVATTIIKGGFEEEIAILFKRGQFEEYGLKPSDIVEKLQSENISLPTGKFERGDREIFVRVKSRFTDIKSLGTLVIKEHENRFIKLSDVAEIKIRSKEPETLTRTNGQDSVFLDVYKEADANIIAVVDGLREATGEKLSRYKWMKDIETKIVSDESTFIRQSISNVVSAGVGGALLAVLILYLFIGELIPSFLIGISIPIAVPITFFLLDKQGITLNVMSLGGLALGIGMLVDNSIVVLENIAKKANEGLDSLNAAIEGTSEMLLPVLASTATTIAVFAPLAFVVGVAGQLFSDLAWTIIYSLTCSLAVAVIVLPTLYVLVHKISTTKAGFLSNEAAKNPITNKFQYLILSKPFYQIVRKNGAAWFKDQRAFYIMSLIKVCFGIPWIVFKLFMFFLGDLLRIIFTGAWLLLRTVGVFVIGILIIITKPISVLAKYCKQTINTWEQTTYPNMITKILEKKINVVIGVLLLGVVAIGLGSQMGGDLLPPLSNTKYFLDGELPLGAGIKTSSTTSYAFEEHLIKTEGITNVVALIGVDEAQALIGNAGINKFTVQFDVDTDVFDKEALEKGLRKFTGVNWTLRQRTLGVQSQPLELVITDNDLDRLRRVALNLKNKLDSASFIALANDTISNGVPELTVEINSSIIGPLGLTPGRIVSDLSHYLRGEKATDIEISDKTLPVIVKAAETDIRAAADLDGIKLLTAQRQSVDLGSIASINKGEGPSYVFRTGGARSIRLSYKPVGVSLSEAAQLLQDQIPPSNLDTEYRVEGQSEEYNESMNSLVFALSLAVFMVYLVMASQFESFTQPLYIMGTIPLAFIGVVLAIYPFGLPISIMVLVGCIVLVGIIVNNAIIFIDSTNRMVKSGVEIGVAVVETGRKRLRPILMTTVTTILGLVPMAFATGEGSALTIAMSRTIIGGLGFGTLLTLVFIPVLIMVFANKKSSKGVSA